MKGVKPKQKKAPEKVPESPSFFKWLLIVGLIIGGFLFLVGVIIASMYFLSSGGYRTCILNAVADGPPDCSDAPGGDGTPKQTRVNGKLYDSCRYVSENGECIE